MNWHRIHRLGLVLGIITLVGAACGSTGGGGGTTASVWATATSQASGGGYDALVAAAKKEGRLNIIATPPDWANYGEIINGFTAKYGIRIDSANPNGSSQQEVDAIKQLQGTNRAPDVVDVTAKVAVANTSIFAPYQVVTWNDILAGQKEATGLWVQDYGGFMSIGYDTSRVPGGTITAVSDLLKPGFKVALAGDPTQSGQGLNGVILASVANGGSLDDVSKGVDFFHTLRQKGNFVKVVGTAATVKLGQTPVLFQWDYLSTAHGKDIKTWKIFVPPDATIGGYYSQAINKDAPHPAAARLWEEYLYSDVGQNAWLKGGARPVRQAAMDKAGTLDKTAAAALPPVTGTPLFPTDAQATAAGAYISAHWAQAIA
jgi:putative spermidine/putrescine transport system substrate-binding protein